MEKDFLKYMPKYRSGWNNEDLSLEKGEMYFGVKDNGTVVGIPYTGILTEEIVRSKLLNIKKNLIGDDIDSLLSSIKIDIIPVKPVYLGETKVVLKDIPDGTHLLARPVPGAYAGMQVKPYVGSKQ